MVDCFGPLGGACAFLGALGFILALFGLVFVVAGPEEMLPSAGRVALFGVALVLLVIVLAVINQFLLPSSCGGKLYWTGF